MADDGKLKEVKMFLRSVLMSQKEGVLLNRLEADYRGITGSKLPLLGSRNLKEFLNKIPDVVQVRCDRDGQVRCFAVADVTTRHIQSLVQRQKSKKGKGRSRGGYGSRGRSVGGSNFRRRPDQYMSPPVPRIKSTVQAVNKVDTSQIRERSAFSGSSRPRFSAQIPLHSSGGDVRTLDNHARIVYGDGDALTVTFRSDQEATKTKEYEVPPRFQKTHAEQQQCTADPTSLKAPVGLSEPPGTYRAAVRMYAEGQGLPGGPQFTTVPVGTYGFVSSLKIGGGSFGSNGFYKTGGLAEEAAAKCACEDLRINVEGKKIYQAHGNVNTDVLKQRLRDLLMKYQRGLLSNKLVMMYEEMYKESAPDNLVESVLGWSDVAEVEESAAMLGVYILRAAQEKRMVAHDLPRVGSSMEVAVTDVVGPDEIYVHPVDWEKTLNKLTSQLQDIYKMRGGLPELSDPVRSMFCAASYSVDNSWYRAQIQDIAKTAGKTEVDVHYIDFGNKEQISTSRTRRLHDSLYSIPAQALKCRLNRVQVSQSHSQSEVADFLYNLLTTENTKLTIDVKSLEDSTVVVDMYCSVLGSKSVNQHVQEKYSEQPSGAQPSSAPPSQPPSAKSSTMNYEPSDIDELIDEAAGDVSDSLDPRESLFIAEQTEMGFMPVVICHIEYDGSFFIQLDGRGTKKLAALTEKITKQLEEPGLEVDEIDEHKLYMAYSDGLWYRVTLTEGSGEGCATAYFVDYGYEQKYTWPTEHLKRLEALDSELYHLPFQAVECELHRFSPADVKWSEAALIRLEELTDSLNVTSTNIEFLDGVTQVGPDNTLTVDLIIETESSMVSVCDKLNGERAALFADVSRSESPMNLPDNIQNDQIQNWNVTGAAGGAAGGTAEKAAEDSAVASLKEFQNLRISAIPSPTSSCKLNSFAPEISRVIEHQEPSEISSSAPCENKQKSASGVSSENAQSNQPESCAKPADNSALNTSSLDAWLSFAASPTSSPRRKESSVNTAQPAQSARHKTVQQPQHNVKENKPAPTVLPGVTKSAIPSRPILGTSGAAGSAAPRPAQVQAPQSQAPLIQTGDKVFVTWVSDPHNIKIIAGKMKPKLKSLMADLDEHFNQRGNAAKSPKTVTIGEMYAGMHDDQQWYRCVVNQILDSMQVTVQFIDYGDHSVLFRACLATLPDKFKKLPPLAVSAKLHGIKDQEWLNPPVPGRFTGRTGRFAAHRWWDQQPAGVVATAPVASRFAALVAEKDFFVTVHHVHHEGMLSITLYPLHSGASINDILRGMLTS